MQLLNSLRSTISNFPPSYFWLGSVSFGCGAVVADRLANKVDTQRPGSGETLRLLSAIFCGGAIVCVVKLGWQLNELQMDVARLGALAKKVGPSQ
jgi:hypothetical protein